MKGQVKRDFDGKCPKNIQYRLCQECKTNESRFVCAGCGNQWYCSKKCQVICLKSAQNMIVIKLVQYFFRYQLGTNIPSYVRNNVIIKSLYEINI